MKAKLNTPAQVADFLEGYNAWRRDIGSGELPQPDATDVGLAIDAAVTMLRSQKP